MIVTGQELGTKLCELFEIDPNEVSKVTVVAEAGQAATVIVERYRPDERSRRDRPERIPTGGQELMPKERPTVASFWVLRPEEHPEAEARNYPGMLQVLQRSCALLGLRHLVLTDPETAMSPLWPAGIQHWATPLPVPLMQACTEAQARYLETRPASDTLFVGADCIFIGDPIRFYPRRAWALRDLPQSGGALSHQHRRADDPPALDRGRGRPLSPHC